MIVADDILYFFFFQAEDGIRDKLVTGVQTCALPISHNINIARTVPDNMGMLFRKHLVMFGPREVLLTSDEPVVKQFLNGRRIGPIGMSEEKDESTMAEEQALIDAGHH